MKRIVALVILSITIASPTGAQWRKIADFRGHDDDPTNMVHEIITCVYFLDLPGPPRIGFVGTESDLYKTTDGGKSWHGVWDSDWAFSNYFVTDITFKDSLTGWFSIFGSPDRGACYRTSNGGESWTELSVPNSTFGAENICYVGSTNRLFLSLANYSPMEVSTDLGNTWAIDASGQTFGYSFSSSVNGIVAASFASYPTGYLITSDGGMTWDSVKTPSLGFPLAISETSTCFEADRAEIIVRRSDDYGRTWRVLKDFGPFADTNGNPLPPPVPPSGTGVIRGDLSRLYIQTEDSGMYVSIDQGATWFNDGGPSWNHDSYPLFYAAKGVTIAGGTLPLGSQVEGGTGLWEEEWPQSGVAEPPSTSSSLRIFPNPATNELQILGGPPGTVRLFDLLGRERAEVRDDGSGATLDISHLEAGAYFVRCGNQSAKVEIAH